MIAVFARLKAPIAGLGRAKVELTRGFQKLHPERRMILVTQAMKQLRAEYDRAETENRNLIKAEDAANADLIRMRA